jgi:hypothetical protein
VELLWRGQLPAALVDRNVVNVLTWLIGVVPVHDAIGPDCTQPRMGLLAPRQEQGTGYGIGNVVMCTARMIDAVAATPRRVAFEGDQLIYGPLVAEQPDRARVNERQGVPIEVRLRLGTRVVLDALLAELFAWPFAREPIADDLGNPIVLQQVCKFVDHAFGAERWLDLARAIEHAEATFIVGNCHCEAVATAASAWIAEGDVTMAAEETSLVSAPIYASLDAFSADEALDVGSKLSAILGSSSIGSFSYSASMKLCETVGFILVVAARQTSIGPPLPKCLWYASQARPCGRKGLKQPAA